MKTTLSFLILYVIVVIAFVGGWIANLVKTVGLFIHSDPITTMFIGRIVGVIVAPLGAILGYF
jgi:hypothetical protein